MNLSLLQLILLLLLGALYLPVAFFVIQRREDGHGTATWLTALYALIAMVATIGEAFGKNLEITAESFWAVHVFTALTLAVVLILALESFLKREIRWRFWGGVWAGWTAVFTALLLLIPQESSLPFSRGQITSVWAMLGWLSFSAVMANTIANAKRENHQQLFQNRLNYWWVILFLIGINDALLFSNIFIAGQPIRLLTAAMTAYVVGTHYLPDVKESMRRILAYLFTALITAGIYTGFFLLAEYMLEGNVNFNPLLTGALAALLVSLFFAPLLTFITRRLNQWLLAGDSYDASRAIHQYSESINNILEVDKLANVAVGIILEELRIERGFLFLVDADRQADGKKLYTVNMVRSPQEKPMSAAELDEDGLIASYFIREQRPLLQYDLDFLPAFQSAAPAEKEWFKQLQAEVYIPIFAKRRWIGLLAFGRKLSGNRYTEEDLMTLGAHANQTAVALENARLVENLMKLNNELRQARRALEKNNRDLERIDQAKSDFISIASHELRTPLTVIKGYSEMLVEEPNLDPNFKLMMKKIHEGTIRLYEVMESMFDIAQLDARSLKPHMQPVEVGLLLKEICFEHADIIKDRKQSLIMEVPALPFIQADANLLRKAFHHLLRNAIKFTDNNGKITISGKVAVPMVDLPQGGVEIIFSDTGVGVDPNFREIIFTKFYQPGELGKHSTSKTRFKGGGAGLGLALSKGVVEAHGGQIWVESPGYDDVNFPGSQFHVILPLNKLDTGQMDKTSQPAMFKV